MKKWFALALLLVPAFARAHIGSPDVFFDGNIGTWPAHVVIRMPNVVPGRAEITVQVRSEETVNVSFVPISARTAASNAPPAELGAPVAGETNLYTGGLWLMTTGAYGIEVHVHGSSGEGIVQIPVNSVAIEQLPLPRALGGILIVLGLVLFFGAMAVIGAAAGESTLSPGAQPAPGNRRKYWIAAGVTGLVLALALFGGNKWWESEENHFRVRLRSGGYPDLAAEVTTTNSRRILHLVIGRKAFSPNDLPNLARDHGKLMHLFLVRQPGHDAFAHVHPIRADKLAFDDVLPPLPSGDYELFCDLTFENGLSSTATNFIHLPPIPDASSGKPDLKMDDDDSWSTNVTASREDSGNDIVCRLDDGTQIIWKKHPALRVRQNAGLQFKVLDASGQPAKLEPYMGMMSHAAVMRTDGRVFSHLHPSGNFSMAALKFFDDKLARDNGRVISTNDPICAMPDMNVAAANDPATVSLPYEFPTSGDYRIWVQVKTGGEVKTGIFDATVN
ncbi:MAG TPA: hypothetical protein VK742_06785 [Candidatus Sulfotelmatobacter sp.]|nr:hypothetical protein [Candidatus Sulfotelmatobacter sp.]